MKLQYPFLLCICLALALYCAKKGDGDISSSVGDSQQSHTLIVERGAFHYDKFILTSSKIEYHPSQNSQRKNSKYNNFSKKNSIVRP